MLDRILVPLDQSRLGEAVLPVVADLAPVARRPSACCMSPPNRDI
jgi:hypothetical protein